MTVEDPGLISVRTEVVLDVLIGSISRAVEQRMQTALPPAVEAALSGAGALLEDPSLTDAASRLARAGWHTRGVEQERFDRAREHDLLLTAMLGGPEACAELAAREPLERPHPDDADAVTWRVPGPGGHVRHYLAERAVGDLPPAQQRAAMKRCWVFGFLLACTPPDALG